MNASYKILHWLTVHLKQIFNVGIATRFCDQRGIWESPNLINCTNEALVNASLLVSFLTLFIMNYKLNHDSPY